MRFRKPAWLRRKSRRRVFAWLPRRLTNGTVVWLEWVERYPLYQGYQPRSDS